MEPKGWGHLREPEPRRRETQLLQETDRKGVLFLKPHPHLPPRLLIGGTI